jgi:hypothetical protein
MTNVFAGARRMTLFACAAIAFHGAYAVATFTPSLHRADFDLTQRSSCALDWRKVEREAQTPHGHTVTFAVYFAPCDGMLDHVVAESRLRRMAAAMDERALDEDAAAQRWAHVRQALAWHGGALVCLLMATWAIGWITRGFLGIPRGMDYPPARTALPHPES